MSSFLRPRNVGTGQVYDSDLYDTHYYKYLASWSRSESYYFELRSLLTRLEVCEKDTVLDVGCGVGETIRYIDSKYSCKVFGIDFPSAWQAPRDLSGLAWADGASLPFSENAFSKVLLIHVIGHVADPVAVLNEVHRVLKPAGKCGIITPNRYFVSLYRLVSRVGLVPHRPDPTVLHFLSREQLAKVVSEAGFRNYTVAYEGRFPGKAKPSRPRVSGWLSFLRERIVCVTQKD